MDDHWMGVDTTRLFESTYNPFDFPDALDAEVVMADSPEYDAIEMDEFSSSSSSSSYDATPSTAFHQACASLITRWEDLTDYLLVPSAFQVIPPPDAPLAPAPPDGQHRIVLLVPGDGEHNRSVLKVTLVVQATEHCRLPDIP